MEKLFIDRMVIANNALQNLQSRMFIRKPFTTVSLGRFQYYYWLKNIKRPGEDTEFDPLIHNHLPLSTFSLSGLFKP